MTTEIPTVDHSNDAQLKFAEFLESSPPGGIFEIIDLAEKNQTPQLGGSQYRLSTPAIQLHCSHENCNGIRFFRAMTTTHGFSLEENKSSRIYINYVCSNCRTSNKTFSLEIRRGKYLLGTAFKFGEIPAFGPPLPSRLMKLIGPDRELFLKGRRCENQGLGIGAFVYYRRVVEGQKNRILEEVKRVAIKIGAPQQQIETLDNALRENQFTTAINKLKSALPESLLINGHNPLTLLHSALSEGLHAQSDEECLEIAHSVRLVLGELSERLAQALKDEVELNKAVSRLLK